MHPRIKRVAVGLATAALVGGVPTAATAAPSAASAPQAQAKTPPVAKYLSIPWEQQEKGYYCAPAATRMALKSWVDKPLSQSKLAGKMGTGWLSGTDNITKVRKAKQEALNDSGFRGSIYYNRFFSKSATSSAKKKRLLTDVKNTVGLRGRAMVVNIKSTKSNKLHKSYPDRNVWHYITIYGYGLGDEISIADPAAGFNRDYENVPKKYRVTADKLSKLLYAGDGEHYYTYMTAP